MLSGSKDELVPPSHMNTLFKRLKYAREGVEDEDEGLERKGKRVWMFCFENGTHNDTCIQPGYFEKIEEFWKEFVGL